MTAIERLRMKVAFGLVLLAFTLALPATALAGERPAAVSAAALTSDDLFDQTAVRDIRLTMKASDWDALVEHYLEDIYYPADMDWQGQVVPIVGVRSRGSGSRNPYKPGLKIDFGRYLSQTFLGMKSLVLANAVQDPSMLKQRAAMLFFAKMGVPAPRVTHVRVFINDRYLGLYMLIEPIDKTFLLRVFGNDEEGNAQNTGYLYEYAWKDAYGFEYLGSDMQIYAELFEAKTRETEAPTLLYGALERLFKDFNEVSDADFEQVVGQQLDLVKFVRFIAVENFLADRDSFLGYWGPNNFYFYRFPSARGAQFITWDKDLAFWAYDYDIFQGARENVLARRALSNPGFHRLYLDTLLACAAAAAAPVSEESTTGWLEAEVQKEVSQIRLAALADGQKPYTNERFEDEAAKVLAFAKARSSYVAREAQKMLSEGRQFR
jgi:spore coat protein CotH